MLQAAIHDFNDYSVRTGFGERIRLQGWIAVPVAFSGMLLPIRPAAETFNAYALLPLASAILYALAMILTNTRCRGENPFALSLSLNVSFIAVGTLVTATGILGASFGSQMFLSPTWPPMITETFGVIAVMTVAILIGVALIASGGILSIRQSRG